jgi:hypothetical protein
MWGKESRKNDPAMSIDTNIRPVFEKARELQPDQIKSPSPEFSGLQWCT